MVIVWSRCIANLIYRFWRQLHAPKHSSIHALSPLVFPTCSDATFDGSQETPIHVNNVPVRFDALWFLVYSADQNLPLGQYVAQARTHKVGKYVPATARAELTEYILGKSSSTQYLDVSSTSAAADGVGSASGALLDPEAKQTKLSTLEDILNNEILTHTRQSVIQLKDKAFPYHTVLAQKFQDVITAATAAPTSAASASTTTSSSSTASSSTSSSAPPASAADLARKRSASSALPNGPKSARSGSSSSSAGDAQIPIIIVPSSATSIINLQNAEEFFAKSSFTDGSKMAPHMSGHALVVKRTSVLDPLRTAVFHIVDNPDKLTPEQWKRVVAIFVTGQAWQLSNLPIGKTPAEIFDKIMGFHLYFEGEEMHANVKNWRVEKVAVSRTKRHQDTMIVANVWRSITGFIGSRLSDRGFMY